MAPLRRQDGSALITALLLLAVMVTTGVALLTVVDTQTDASAQQRDGETAFNLAESALAAAAFALSADWPEGASAARPWTQVPTCGAQDLSGGVSSSASTGTLAGRVERLVAEGWKAGGGSGTPQWRLNVCDAGDAKTWTAALLGRAPYDATGRRTATRPDGSTYTVRQMWVRATGTIGRRSRTVAALVQAREVPAFPSGYGVLAGKMGFLNGLNTVTDSVLGDQTALGTLTNALLGTTPMVSGRIGIRCGLLEDLCLDSVASTLTSIPLLDSIGLTNGQVVQHGSSTATAEGTLRRLRDRAIANGTYVEQVASTGSCIPSGATTGPESVVFVEQVGSGDGTCRIASSPSRTIGAVVVGRGRIELRPPTSGSTATVTGVLYAANLQDQRQAAVISVGRGAKVRGGVFADGGGVVALTPPNFSITSAVCSSPLISLLCLLTPATELLDAILDTLGVNGLLTLLLPQLSTYGPIVEHDASVVARHVVPSSSGALKGSFRQVSG